ncbi:hypothetical protein AX14_007459 [Amanita brunnescens Koide BX004]|nr:hypothetical protein AX14_007459 [Amanita brunnescens Koide BX004]
MKTVVPAVDAVEGVHPAWPKYEFIHKHPFSTWIEFSEEMRQYFLTTETHAEAVKKLRELKQGDKTIEEFIIEFKGWAQLAGFDRIALVDQFKRGINVNLGRRIIELGSPGDGTDPTHLQRWYDRATELERQKRDSDQYYGKRESFQQKKKKWNEAKKKAETSTEKPKAGIISVKVKDENAMDVRWGYNNIRIKDGDEYKAAFRTNRGLFEPLVMFFGLTNSPATFQTMMNDIFREEIAQGWVVIYMDDILVFSHDKDLHQKQVKIILQKLEDHQLSLKAEKCYFDKEEIDFLGLIISQKGIRMDPGKVKAVTDWPTPRTKRELQQFLGFVNFYRRFVKGFAGIAKPLTKLTGKEPWNWTQFQQEAFQRLKDEITSERVLMIPKPGRPF